MPRLIAMSCLLCWCMALQAASSVPLIKNGNVRYGPSTNAGVIVTLKVGDTVEMLGPVEGKAGWYRVAFPQQGYAWIHEKVVMPSDREKVLRVIVDGARVRSDSTIGGEVVADLAVGDEIEVVGNKVGSWYRVYVPSAPAYIYHSVLDLTQARSAVASQTPGVSGQPLQGQASSIEQLWQQVQQIYRENHAVHSRDRAEAATLDWQGLLVPLERVVNEHPDLRTRLIAERMRSVIRNLDHVGMEPPTPEKMGLVAPQTVAAVAQPPVAQPPVAQPPVAQPPVAQPPVVEVPVAQPPVAQPPAPQVPVVEPNQSLAQMPEGTVVEGWVEPQEVPGLGVRYAVLGERGVAAFIALPADSGIDLKQLFWRRVRVIGKQLPVEAGLPPEYAGVPTIEVADIRVVQ